MTEKHWLHKEEFKQLINNFLSSKINGKDFDQQFSQLVREIGKESNLKNHAKLKRIEIKVPNPKDLELISIRFNFVAMNSLKNMIQRKLSRY